MSTQTYTTYAAAIAAHGIGAQIAVYGPADYRVHTGSGSPSWAATDLAAAQAAAIAQINAKRDATEQGTFAYLGKLIDADPVSCQRITVAASTAQMALSSNVPYALEWSCADNSLLPLDALGVLGMMQALGSHGLAVHLHARGLKTAVLAATTVEQVAAVDLATGWPA